MKLLKEDKIIILLLVGFTLPFLKMLADGGIISGYFVFPYFILNGPSLIISNNLGDLVNIGSGIFNPCNGINECLNHHIFDLIISPILYLLFFFSTRINNKILRRIIVSLFVIMYIISLILVILGTLAYARS